MLGGEGYDDVDECRESSVKGETGNGSQTDGKHRKLPHEGVAERLISHDLETGKERSLMRCVAGSGGVCLEKGFQRIE